MTQTIEIQQSLFDYAALDTETRIVVQQRTSEIKTLMRRSAQDIIDIGQKLIEVKARLGHGNFGGWLESEFSWTDRTAQQFMNVANRFKSENFSDLSIAPSALYALAAPSTPEPARVEAIERAQAGEAITHSAAKAIINGHKPTQTVGDDAVRLDAIRRVVRSQPDAEAVILDDLSGGRRGWYHETILCYCDDTTPEDWQRIARQYVKESAAQAKPQSAQTVAPERADPSLTVEHVATLIRQALAERDDCPELEAYKGSRWSLFLAERYQQWPTIDTTRQAIKEVQRKPSQPEAQFVPGEPKPYPTGDIMPNGHATEYNPVRLAVTPVTQRPLSVTECEAAIARYIDRHGKSEDLSFQRAMVESLIIPDMQPILRDDRTITYDTFKNAKRRIADEMDRQIHAAKQAKPKANGMAVHFSSETPEHYTPQEVIAAVIACMGGIDLDPCSNSHESPNVPATTYYTQADDGLRQQWRGRVYMNPPYGREIVDWVIKLVAAYEAGDVTEAIALVPSRTDTKWWSMLRDYPVCLVSGRLKFGEAENGAPFPSAVFYLAPAFETGKFLRSFDHLGDIWQRVLPENVAE